MSQTYHPNKGPLLRRLNPGDRFTGYYVLRQKQLEPFRDPSRGYYLTLILGDRSGQLLARVWENAEDADNQLSKGAVVKVDGEAETYLDRLQIRVFRVRPADPQEYDLRDMLPTSPKDPQEMVAELQTHLDRVSHPHMRALLEHFFADQTFLDLFSQAPAARRMHHAYLGGLLEHILEMLALTSTVLELYPQIDADLLLTGVLLHDIGKLREYQWQTDIDFSDEGRLLGHIVMADEAVSAALAQLPNFPAELALRLRHMLLAHHGSRKRGSPRRPKTLEAIALHHIKELSAQTNRFHLLLRDRPPQEHWTAYDTMLRRQLYAGQDDHLDEQPDEDTPITG